MACRQQHEPFAPARQEHGDRYDQLPEMAADLVRREVAVIATTCGPATASAAKAATSSIPIVFVTGTDPVDTGLVSSLSRPNANLTGVHLFTVLLSAKRWRRSHRNRNQPYQD
jgi:putative tryptophan/tyrosine transport system substrate-binding protein